MRRLIFLLTLLGASTAPAALAQDDLGYEGEAPENIGISAPPKRPSDFLAVPIVLTIHGPMPVPPVRESVVEDTQAPEEEAAQAPAPPEGETATQEPTAPQSAPETNSDDILRPPVRPAVDFAAAEIVAENQAVGIPRPQERGTAIPRKLPIAVAQNETATQTSSTNSTPNTGSRQVNPPVATSECFNQLKRLNVKFSRLANTRNAQGCELKDAIEVTSFNGIALRPSGQLTCKAALATAQWLKNDVVPSSRRMLNRRLIGIEHYSTYSCRRRPSGRLSEHAFGNAIDVAKFFFADGSSISLDPDWNAGGSVTRFLKHIAQASCKYFSVVLSPDSDAAHFNHFHLDTGRWKVCIN